MSELLRRLNVLFHRRELDRDLEDELAFHLAMKQEREGITSHEARRALGNPTQHREALRDLWTFTSVEALWKDLRYGARTLGRNPGFTAVAVLSLAIGIGGNTAIFSLVNTIMLKSLPVPEPQQLRVFTWQGGRNLPVDSSRGYGDYNEATRQQTGGSFSYPMFAAFRERLSSMADVFAFYPFECAAMVAGNTDFAPAQSVSGNYFSALAVVPLAGRLIEPADDQPGAPRVTVISYRFWERRFGLDPRAIGSPLAINGRNTTIVGILPNGVEGLNPGKVMDLYIPLAMQPELEPELSFSDNRFWWVQIFGRLRPNASEQQFLAAAGIVLHQVSLLSVRPGDKNVDTPQMKIDPGGQGLSYVRRGFARPAAIAAVVVGIVLLIACANLANLLLARGAARRREIAVRIAIGAGRFRLVRQLLTESVLLASLGGALGILFANPLAQLAIRFGSGREQILLDTRIDAATLAFTFSVSMLSALLFGLAPAWQATHVDLSPALKESGGLAGNATTHQRTARILVAAQVALSTLLLVGAGLFVRSLVKLSSVELGFNPERLLVFDLDPTRGGYKGARALDLYRELRRKLESIPGVESVALLNPPLIAGNMSRTTIQVPGHSSSRDNPARTWIMRGSSGFLTSLGIHVIAGRDLAPSDNASNLPAAVVNETFARRYFDGQNPVGRTFDIVNGPQLHIVGMARDAKYESLRQAIQPTTYLQYEQWPDRIGAMSVNIRTKMPPQAIVSAVRRIVSEIDRQLPVASLRTEDEQIALSIGPERFFAGFVGGFGIIAALLAAIGLYGVIAYNVARRTSEIGVRLALGARRGDVQWLVMRESVILVAAGLSIGIPAALASNSLLQKLLYGVTATDPLSFLAGASLMLAIAALAAWLPARRAARLDPLVALRHD